MHLHDVNKVENNITTITWVCVDFLTESSHVDRKLRIFQSYYNNFQSTHKNQQVRYAFILDRVRSKRYIFTREIQPPNGKNLNKSGIVLFTALLEISNLT